MMRGRRAGVAIALSVAFHGVALAIVIGSSLIGAWPTAPVEIEINGMKMEELRDLPLGQAAAGARIPHATEAPAPSEGGASVAPVKDVGPKPKAKPRPARVIEAPPDGGAAPPRPQSVRSYAPQGSRVTALMRIDRLRGTPYAPVVDAVLMRLPDRRDLLEGTDLDLYRDVDALLLATPDPVDPAVTFLAVRHHLTDAVLRAALEKGARATGRKLTWRSERGRPFAERHAIDKEVRQRDERLILLAAPHLAVVTPPAYRSLILQGPPKAGAAAGSGGQGGAGGEVPADEHASWAALIRRIDAEDSIMPANAVAMLSGEDLFSARRPRVVAGTRGTGDDDGPRPPAPRLYGLPVPGLFTATIGIAPQPFADVDGTFSDEADAAQVEQRWPALRHTLLSNPLVVLTGFSGLIGRVSLSRAGATVHLHIEATEMETIRIMQLLATQAFPLGG